MVLHVDNINMLPQAADQEMKARENLMKRAQQAEMRCTARNNNGILLS
jgi:hypothetical protein